MHAHVSILMHRCENTDTHMTTRVDRSGMLPSNQGKDLDRAGTLCLELVRVDGLAQELCDLWEPGLGVTWAGA